MNIKQSTIDKYQKLVDILIDAKDWEKALKLASRFIPRKGYIICKTRLFAEYVVKNDDITSVAHIIKQNSHYSNASELILFLRAEVKDVFQHKQK
jgi:hypothetical protein